MTNFHDLYQNYAGDIYRFAYWLTGSRDQAEEITAETFARALTGGGAARSSTVKGYLLTIARNTYLEQRRKHRTQTELDPELEDHSPRPDTIAEQRDELRTVFDRIRLLPGADREALLLRADGLPYDEIARTLKITLTSAKVKVHRARMKLLKWREQW